MNEIVSVGRKGGLIKSWTQGVPMEESAIKQIENVASMPFIHKHVAIMPDAHWGMGATVGSVIATKGAIIPAAVGVDIGCGMIAQKTSLRAEDLPDNLHAMRTAIEAAVPHGRTDNGGVNDRGAWGDTPRHIQKTFSTALLKELNWLVDKHPVIERAAQRADKHLGTLGGGNHFVEVCLDKEGAVWVMLHSGSRGIGNRIGSHFIELAKKDMERWFINLPDKDLSYLVEGSTNFNDYVEAVSWAQKYAFMNRQAMMFNTLSAIRDTLGLAFEVEAHAVNCHHNYISNERHFGDNIFVTRKGAVSAKEGELGIIPGSMGARSFITRGLGNRESFCSCSHGAGRVMSRNEARRTITMEQHLADTAGVECRKDEEVIDESPKAYKDIEAVMAAQSDLVEIVAELKQVLCVKG